MKKVNEVMTRDVRLASPDETLRDAARMMKENDVGSLPIGDDDRLVGMLTDRDLVIRGLAEGHTPDTPIREVMTRDIKYCYEDEDVEHVAANMAQLQVRRLPVVNRDKRLVGIVSLANVAHSGQPEPSQRMVKGVAAPH